jgi:hypothetical protein
MRQRGGITLLSSGWESRWDAAYLRGDETDRSFRTRAAGAARLCRGWRIEELGDITWRSELRSVPVDELAPNPWIPLLCASHRPKEALEPHARELILLKGEVEPRVALGWGRSDFLGADLAAGRVAEDKDSMLRVYDAYYGAEHAIDADRVAPHLYIVYHGLRRHRVAAMLGIETLPVSVRIPNRFPMPDHVECEAYEGSDETAAASLREAIKRLMKHQDLADP